MFISTTHRGVLFFGLAAVMAVGLDFAPGLGSVFIRTASAKTALAKTTLLSETGMSETGMSETGTSETGTEPVEHSAIDSTSEFSRLKDPALAGPIVVNTSRLTDETTAQKTAQQELLKLRLNHNLEKNGVIVEQDTAVELHHKLIVEPAVEAGFSSKPPEPVGHFNSQNSSSALSNSTLNTPSSGHLENELIFMDSSTITKADRKATEQVVPEPSSFVLALMSGLGMMIFYVHRWFDKEAATHVA